jgi:hypothetical protein
MLTGWTVMATRRTKKWIISLAGLAAIFTLLAVVLWFFVLPPFLEKRIRSALRNIGYSDASIEIDEISWSGATLKNLLLGPKYGFRVGEIRVVYSLASLRRSSVDGIVVDGLEADIGIRDKKIDFGPLTDLRLDHEQERESRRRTGLPFDSIELQNARLTIDWEGREHKIPLTGVIRRIESDSVSLQVLAAIEGAPLKLKSAVNIESREGTAEFEIDKLPAELLGYIGKQYLTKQPLNYNGYVRLDGNASLRNDNWLADCNISSDDLLIEAAVDSSGRKLVLTDLHAKVGYVHLDSSTFHVDAALNDIPLAMHGSVNTQSLNGQCRLLCNKITSEQLKELISSFAQELPLDFQGQISIEGTATARRGELGTDLTVDGKKLNIRAGKSDHRVTLSQPLVNVSVQLAYDSGRVHDMEARVKLARLSAVDTTLGITIEEVVFDAPISLEHKMIDQATFRIRNIDGNRLHIPAVAGSFSLSKDSAWIDLSAGLLPGADLLASGRFGYGKDTLSGEADARIPSFTLENTDELVALVPELEDSEIGGTFEVKAHLDIQKNRLLPWMEIDLENAFWKKQESDVSIDGLSGALLFNNITPPATDGEQQLRWTKMTFGAFEATDGRLSFQLSGDDSTLSGSVESRWLNGRIWSDSLIVRQGDSRVYCDLHVEELSLQGILDFLKYEGVKGKGRIDGNLPVSVNWGQRTRISFGDGVLQANPQKGRLQLSKETAMMFLGLTHDIDPSTAEQQDMAKLLMLNALQDMEYSLLELDFDDDEEYGWVTRIQIKGHGPYGDEANRIPIGGIDIEVNNLDDLLNSVILPGYKTRNLKLGDS